MKLRKILLGAGVALPLLLAAQPAVMNTDARGYLERAQLMYESRNYVGAIDQLIHFDQLGCDDDDLCEQAELLLALSHFERGEAASIDELIAFIEEHPTSPRAQTAQLKVGNYFFYRDDWENALVSYSLVRERALDGDSDEDVLYRIAYCNLRLGKYDDAKQLYGRLARTKRYGDATEFYDAYIDYANGDLNNALTKFQAINATSELGYQAQYYVTQIKYNHKLYDQVISAGRQLLAEGQNDYFDAELNRMVGESYYHQGDREQARVYLQRYFDNPEGDIYRTAAYVMGVLNYDDAQYQQCIDLMSLATDLDDSLAQSAWLYLGQAKLKLGDENGSARAFEQAAKMSHDAAARETALYNYAVAQHKGARTPFGKSIDLFEQFLNDYPNSKYKDKVEGYLIDSYTSGNDYARALESINHINRPGDKVLKAKQWVLYNLGVQSLSSGDVDAAVTYLQQAVDLGNKDKAVLNEARLWLAEAQYRNGNYNAATANQMAYVNAAGSDDANRGIAQYNLGYSLFQQRRYSEAQQAFRRAIDSHQLSDDLLADAYNRLGDTQYYARDYSGAKRSYEQAIQADANATHDYAMYQQAIMAGLGGDLQGEITQLDAMLKRYPRSPYAPQAMLEKGHAQSSLGKANDAISTYDALVRAYPKSAEARKAMLQAAIEHNNAGNTDKAVDAFKRVIKSYPTSEEAQAAAEDLKMIYADRGELPRLQSFLASIPNGPRLDVNEVDRLNFEAAEKEAIADNPSITRMQTYLQQNPDSPHAPHARYYIARHAYIAGNYDEALRGLDEALKGGADASWAEDALAMRAGALDNLGRHDEALAAYRTLVERSSSDDNRIVAQLGLMRTAVTLKKWNDVINTSTALLTSGGLTADEEREVTLNRALALINSGKATDAQDDLKQLAADPQSLEGARAAVELATLQYEASNYKAAERTVNALIEAGTPHSYWLARAFIVLADCCSAQGRYGEAREYLQSLKNNYPGNEKDIAEAIDSRLRALKKK